MAEKNKEYASTYFGFTAGAFADTIFNVGNESIAASLKKFRKEMQQKCPPGKVLEFDKAFQALTVRTETRGMQLNDKLKFVLESRVFNIPPHIVVGDDNSQNDYEGQDKHQVERDLDREIEEAEKKILACEFAHKELSKSIVQNEALAEKYEQFLAENKGQKDFATALSTEMNKVVSCSHEANDLLP